MQLLFEVTCMQNRFKKQRTIREKEQDAAHDYFHVHTHEYNDINNNEHHVNIPLPNKPSKTIDENWNTHFDPPKHKEAVALEIIFILCGEAASLTWYVGLGWAVALRFCSHVCFLFLAELQYSMSVLLCCSHILVKEGCLLVLVAVVEEERGGKMVWEVQYHLSRTEK